MPFHEQVAWRQFEGKKCRSGAGAGGGRDGTPRGKSRALAAPCVHFFRPSCALVRSRSRSPAKVHILPYFAVVCADARWRCGQSRHFCPTTSIVEACSAGERAVPRRLTLRMLGSSMGRLGTHPHDGLLAAGGEPPDGPLWTIQGVLPHPGHGVGSGEPLVALASACLQSNGGSKVAHSGHFVKQ